MNQALLSAKPLEALEVQLEAPAARHRHASLACGHGTLAQGVVGGAVACALNALRLGWRAYQAFGSGSHACSWPRGCPSDAGIYALHEAMSDEDACRSLHGDYHELVLGEYGAEEAGAADTWMVVQLISHLLGVAAAAVAARAALRRDDTHLRVASRALLLVFALGAAVEGVQMVSVWLLCSDTEVEEQIRCEAGVGANADHRMLKQELACAVADGASDVVVFLLESLFYLWYFWVVFCFEKQMRLALADDDDAAPLERHSRGADGGGGG